MQQLVECIPNFSEGRRREVIEAIVGVLADLRKGKYEGLKTEIASAPARRPDFGQARLHPTAGATAVGARPPLIAFNVNLGTSNLQVAKTIAKGVRESSGGLMN